MFAAESCLTTLLSLHTKVMLEIRAATLAHHVENKSQLLEIGESVRLLTAQGLELYGTLASKKASPRECEQDPSIEKPEFQDQQSESASLIQASSIPSAHRASILHQPTDDLLMVTAVHRNQCDRSCHCECHFRQTRISSASWLQNVIGSFFLSYDSLPLFAPRKCSLISCHNSRNSIEFQYYLPLWACIRGISMSICRNSAFGRGASISLEFPAVIGFSHPLYGPWKFKSLTELADILAKDKIRPYDTDAYGYSVLFVSKKAIYGTAF